MSIMRKAAAIYKKDGLQALMERTFVRAMNTVCRTNSAFWYEYDLSQECKEVSPVLPVVIVPNAREETIAWIRKHGEPWMYNRNEITSGIDNGHYYPHVTCNGSIIGYAKIAVGNVYIEDLKRSVALPEGYAFIYDTYVSPLYRGNRIGASLITRLMKRMKNEGMQKIGCHIPPWNTASIRMYTGIGFRMLTYIRNVRILGISISTAKIPFTKRAGAGNAPAERVRSHALYKTPDNY